MSACTKEAKGMCILPDVYIIQPIIYREFTDEHFYITKGQKTLYQITMLFAANHSFSTMYFIMGILLDVAILVIFYVVYACPQSMQNQLTFFMVQTTFWTNAF